MLVETRGNDQKKPKKVAFSDAILNPSASFGGLYAPQELPRIEDLSRFKNLSYEEFAKEIFALLGLEIEPQILLRALLQYRNFDDPSEPTPLRFLDDKLAILELYHGNTRAFKDMALQPFGSIFSELAKHEKKRFLILAATSGDTGPATLESFAGRENIDVVCLYPHGGTSDVQRLQMTTQSAKNLKVIGIHGDFDDAQSALKSLLKDDEFIAHLKNKGVFLSAANSVNFGRIAFQIIYHAYASLKSKSAVNIIVPSGNFGNALGAFYAKKMGFPIEKIVIASNANNILTELFTTGIYDIRGKKLKKTISPAMDILKSSNVERLLFALFGENRTKELMENLETHAFYELSASELEVLREHFEAIFCNDDECEKIIAKYASKGYLLDPHTACGIKAHEYFDKGKNLNIVCSTAEWTKFAPAIARALGGGKLRDLEALKYISKVQNSPICEQITALFDKPEVHKDVVEKEAIKRSILEWI